MKQKGWKRLLTAMLVPAMVASALPIHSVSAGSLEEYTTLSSLERFASAADTDVTTKVYADTYAEPGYNRNWREGMVSGNGNNGVVTSGAPYSDTMIFQNMRLIMPSNQPREALDTITSELEKTREEVFNLNPNWRLTNNRDRTFLYAVHPGHQLRLTMDAKQTTDYLRWTDYETAEVGVSYTDADGSWERRTFTSRADDVTITEIQQSSTGSKINMTLSLDNLSSMYKFGRGDEQNMQYKKLVDEDADYIALVGHYPNYENSELKNGGYVGVTQVVVVGGEKEAVSLDGSRDSQNVGAEANPGIQITDADAVYLITRVDRTHDMGTLDSFAGAESYALVNTLFEDTDAVVQKYSSGGSFDYEAALAPHVALHKDAFDNVKFSLNASEEDRALTNNALLSKQKSSANELNDALVERAYNAGRYAELCCAGYMAPKLTGMWTGEWNPGWRGIYTQDANVNLQVSPMNTGNMEVAGLGYIYFILDQADDWLKNAECSYGMHDAIQAHVTNDGDRSPMVESDSWYPFQYWNAGCSWMLLPIYEYWQCFGNQQIPIPEHIDLYDLQEVLGVEDGGLTTDEVQALIDRGYLDLEADILLPLLTKQANFWEQLCTPEYYMDANGNKQHEEGKTELEEGETYLLIPTYSPENAPAQYGNSMTMNATMDIAAAKDGLNMTIMMEKAVNGEENNAQIARWTELLNDLPAYQYDGEPGVETATGGNGALREWSVQDYVENNNHRHISHLYVAWPAYETQHDEELAQAAAAALANRDRLNTGDNTTGHGWMHHSLISARLKDGTDVYDSIKHILSSDIYYTSMMTDHNTNRGSDTYCTDTSIGMVAVINEALAFSNTGEIQILPALPEQWESGSISGMMARTWAELESLSWDLEKGISEVTIRSSKDQTIDLSCGLGWTSYAITTGQTASEENGILQLTLQEGESATIQFFSDDLSREGLQNQIQQAEAALDAKQPNAFPTPSSTNTDMQTAINSAKAVYNDPDASDEMIRNAIWSLVDSVRAFEDAYAFTYSIPGGYYTEKQAVTIALPTADGVEIRYTMDGTEPTADSTRYTGAITLPAGILHLKAAAFIAGTDVKLGETLSETYQCNFRYNMAAIAGISTNCANYDRYGVELAVDGDASTRWAVSGNQDTYTLEFDLKGPTEVDSLYLDEYVEVVDQETHRITKVTVEYLDETGEWKTAHVLDPENPTGNEYVDRPAADQGSSHAYYGAQFEPVTATKVRVNLEATKEISIWELAIFKTQAASGLKNVAAQKPTTSSSFDGPTPDTNATDGKWNTRWAASSYHFPEWLQVDLQDLYYVEEIYTLFELPSGFQFKIEYSCDGETWHPYADHSDNTETIYENLSQKDAVARYVRITLTGSTEQHWASLWEFQVFGRAVAAIQPETVSATVGESVTLPKEAVIQLEDGTEKTHAVQWENETVSYAEEGTYTVTGEIAELHLPYTVTIAVKDEESGGGSSGGGSTVTRYTITVTQTEGGKISPSTTTVTSGSNQTFTITPDEDHQIEDVLVDGKSVGAVSTYTFRNVKSSHTITAEFTTDIDDDDTPLGDLPFDDVKANDWFAEAVQYVVDHKLMTGVASDKFAPQNDTTRGMIVTILYREAGSPAVESDGKTWWSDARVWAMEEGISDGTNMEGTITREQLAAMLYRYVGSPAVSGTITGFSDTNSISDWASDAMLWAVQNGILNGSNGKLNPQGNASRAEVAAMLMRFCENEAK